MVLLLIVGTPITAFAGEIPEGKPFQAIWEELEDHQIQIDDLKAKISDLQAQLNAETAARIAADAILEAAIQVEEAARIAADAVLQAQIDNLQARLDALQLQLNAETAARIAADDALQANIDAEEAARIVADNQLQANIDAEEAARIAADNALLPRGVIVMWSGSISDIPVEWALCDGGTYTAPNGDSVQTPDLSGQFVVGYDDTDPDYNAVGKTGGEEKHTLTAGEMPSHSHSGYASSVGNHRHYYSGYTYSVGNHRHRYEDWYDSGTQGVTYGPWNARDNDRIVWKGWSSLAGAHSHSYSGYTDYSGAHTHSFTTDSAGSSQPHENRPPYFTVAFIMKL